MIISLRYVRVIVFVRVGYNYYRLYPICKKKANFYEEGEKGALVPSNINVTSAARAFVPSRLNVTSAARALVPSNINVISAPQQEAVRNPLSRSRERPLRTRPDGTKGCCFRRRSLIVPSNINVISAPLQEAVRNLLRKNRECRSRTGPTGQNIL
ncbi:MAG: hypothetical protein IK083_07345, partial [Abditibacteriota bacterium]|nr:hypothetical protein [Abditibacteriota bacterium]